VAGAVRHYCRLYSGCAPSRLWRGQACAAALLLALSAGGCSLSYQLDSFFGGSDKTDTTGSITPPPGTKQAADLPSDGDLAYARAAASEVLKRDEKDASVPWTNPKSGARGTVTPIASAYSQDGQTCRNFLASYVNGSNETWLQGEACKQAKGAWQVRSLKPWKRS
jgi:surface antigen